MARIPRIAESYIDVSPGLSNGSTHLEESRLLEYKSDYNVIQLIIGCVRLADRELEMLYDFDKMNTRMFN